MVSAVSAIVERAAGAERVWIDMPIGLMKGGPDERACDRAARAVLGPRRGSSVFRVPVRAAVHAVRELASQVNNERTGKRLSQQALGIIGKIADLDRVMSAQPNLQGWIRETHPEVCFVKLAGRQMEYPKRLKAGREEREEALRERLDGFDEVYWPARQAYRRQAKPDDILDAVVAALAAAQSRLATLPADPPVDAAGLRMEIAYGLPDPAGPSAWGRTS